MQATGELRTEVEQPVGYLLERSGMAVGLEVSPAFLIEECRLDTELPALESEWYMLWAECPHATPFQSPEWLIPWWNHLGQGELWILAVRRDNRLVGLAPLLIQQHSQTAERTV